MRSWKEFLMNPKHIISSSLKKYGSIIPDTIFLRLQYRLLMGKKLDLRNPKSFTEKIQWLKIHNRQHIMKNMVDKLAVKEYVANKIGSEYIIPTIGVWNSLEEMNWEALPNQFVLKTTHGGGGTGVVVVRDKKVTTKEEIVEKLRWSYNREGYYANREWPYKDVPKRIIAEKLIEIPEKFDLTDYKIYCFNGKPLYIQVIQDRNTCETIDFFDTEWNHQEFVGLNPLAKNAKNPISKPENLKEMLWAAEKLAKGFDFVRIDMYQVRGKALFGEITFFPASGIGAFTPSEYDRKLGDLLHLSTGNTP